ncbi:MAG: histidine kinase [Moraxellaceae bacterium]|nr:MAG: histidine kinase [Moraxellaceae bacterium]
MPNTLSDENIKQVLEGISVPPQPQVLVDIHMEQAAPNVDIDRIAELIRQDIGLAGTVLKVVNSKYFGLANKISSIQQAVELLGKDCIVNIVNGLAIKSELSDEAIVAMSRFWDSATDVALVAATLAKQVGLQNVDEAYALGLFHCCGMPLLMTRFSNYNNIIEQAFSGTDERIIDTENRHFNTNHAVVGYFVAKSWNLPSHLCELIAEQYNLSTIFDAEKRFHYESNKKNLLAILKMAQDICDIHQVLGKQDTNHDWEKYSSPILEYIGLSQYDYDNLKEGFDDMGSIL